MATIPEMRKAIKTQQKPRSAYDKGVMKYALELLDSAEEALQYYRKYKPNAIPTNWAEFEKMLLNGARDWREYSYGGCSLIYDDDIAERLCTPSELKQYRAVRDSRKDWLQAQARALSIARSWIRRVY